MANKNIVNCKVCGAEIAKKAKTCPHCGAKNKKGHPILIIFALLLVVLLFSCGGEGDETPSNVIVGDEYSEMSNGNICLITEPTIVKTSYGTNRIEGEIKNTSGKTLSYVCVKYAVYDKDGVQLDTGLDNIENLTTDSVWKFSVGCLGTDKFASFELTEVTAH